MVALGVTAPGCAPAAQMLGAAALVSSREGGVTFTVECRNPSAQQPVERVNVVNAFRLDGAVREPGFIGSFLGGAPPPAPPGSTWTETVSLLPMDGYSSATPSTGRAFRVSLQAGQHTVAFRCAGRWSEEVAFSWQPPAPPQSPSSVAEELTRIEHALAAAWKNGDCDGWGAHIADGWSVIHLDGSVMTREQVVAMCRGPRPEKIERFAIDDVSVRTFGDTAVVTGRSVLEVRTKTLVTVRLRFTDVFHRENSRWRVVASQATSIAR
jgi:ketosteroid isomerase-like protein